MSNCWIKCMQFMGRIRNPDYILTQSVHFSFLIISISFSNSFKNSKELLYLIINIYITAVFE